METTTGLPSFCQLLLAEELELYWTFTLAHETRVLECWTSTEALRTVPQLLRHARALYFVASKVLSSA